MGVYHVCIDKWTSNAIATSEPAFRSILGIAFDPMDTSPNPTVYVAHSSLFHGQVVSYNGKVSAVSGKNLDQLEHKVTGLPVSDHDHGVNGLEFGDNGELYIQVGGTTNAGVPGALSSSGLQDESLFSAATVVAYLSRPNFKGFITYKDNGDLQSDVDVETFATGQRNSFDIVMHSNGNLYATDNGPNTGYGKKATGCGSDGDDPHEDDELNLIVKGGFYGHPNRMRSQKQQNKRECTWRSALEPSDADYTAPLSTLQSSANGIAEFQSKHFGGQLRGQLLIGRYKGALFRVPLSKDGRSVVGKPIVLTDSGGLDVTQGPDGTLFVAQNAKGKVIYHSPADASTNKLETKSVFPRRGPKSGGSVLTIYGENLDSFGTPTVFVGGTYCPLTGATSKTKITCILPAGNGNANVVVTSGGSRDEFTNAYRYISGKEA